MNSILGESPEKDEKLLKISAEMDSFEGYQSPHGRRIASIADSLAAHFNLASRDRFFLQQAALLHDVGEFIMGREYVGASRRLTVSEKLDLQRHPVVGEQETARLGLPRGTQLIVRWHHEWWNGSGYPDGLANEQIPLAARILRISDSYAALTASRPFRPAVTVEQAEKYLRDWAGIEFDPTVVKAFLHVARAARERSRSEVPAGAVS